MQKKLEKERLSLRRRQRRRLTAYQIWTRKLEQCSQEARSEFIKLSLENKNQLHIFGRYFFPNVIRGTNEVPECHKALLAEIAKREDSAIIFPRGHAKAQSLDSNILTSRGWKKLKDIKIGDFVFGLDGKRKRVLQLHPISIMDLYRVKTRDGRSTLCNLEHLWTVQIPSNTGDKVRVLPLKEIKDNYVLDRFDKRSGKAGKEYRYFVPTAEPIEFKEKKLSIDPYTLGAWLGDGTSENGSFTTADEEILSYFPYETSKQNAIYRYTIWKLCRELRQANLLKNKHIPKEYFFGSIQQRTELLQGLIDTDGYIQKDGARFGFCNKNKVLIDGFVDLVRSLGGTCTVGEQMTRFDKQSEYKKSFVVTGRLPKEIIPVRLSRKRNLWKGSIKTKSAIISIEYEKTDLGRCITVEDGNYITDDYLVTHNSTWVKIDTLHDIVYGLEPVILYISNTLEDAGFHFESMKSELENNELLRSVYGDIVPPESDLGRKWTNKHFQTTNGINVVARGACKGRGVNIKNQRPSKIIIDDAEDDEMVLSPVRRLKFENWLYQVIMPSKDQHRGYIKMIGTVLAQHCQVLRFYEKHGGIFRRAIENGKSIWSDMFALEKLESIREKVGTRSFSQEYMNNPIDEESAIIKPVWINDTTYNTLPNDKGQIKKIVMLDPQSGGKEGSDYYGLIVLGYYHKDIHRYVLQRQIGRDTQMNQAALFVRTIQQNPETVVGGIEKVMSQVAVYQLVLEWKSGNIDLPDVDNNNRNISVIAVEPKGKDKIARLQVHEASFERGEIHLHFTMTQLADQLVGFPNIEHDDDVDALIYALDYSYQNNSLTNPFGSGNNSAKTHTNFGFGNIYKEKF